MTARIRIRELRTENGAINMDAPSKDLLLALATMDTLSVNSFGIVREAALNLMNDNGYNSRNAMLELFNREHEALQDDDMPMAMFWAKVQQFLSPPSNSSTH